MGDRVTQLRVGPSMLAERIAAARARLFVGRTPEIAAFDAFVAADSPQALWFITGAGGVGKSALLQHLRERADGQRLASVFVDARQVPPNPPAVRHALARAAGTDSFEAFCQAHARPLLLIDTFEYWQALELWLRVDYLPLLPATLKVIVCSRAEPSLEWRTDEGWRSLMQLSTLAPLEAPACDDYLQRRGVDADSRGELIRFSDGHPLALAMGADSVLSGHRLGDLTEGSDDAVIQGLVDTFTREARSADERLAMDACAVVREVNDSLLAAMLGRNDVSALLHWLRGLAFIQAGEQGVFPHDLVREVLIQQMPRHYPGRYEALARAAFDWTVDRIERMETLSWGQAVRMAAEGMYALRALPMVQHFLEPVGPRSLYLDRARVDDEPALADMVLQHQGAESLRWFRFWYQRCPGCTYVVRGARETPRGLFVKLDMETLDAVDRDLDPLTCRLWSALTNNFAIRPGEHAPFIRFWLTAACGQSQCPEKTQILMAVNTYNLMADSLRVTAQVFADSADWVIQARALGIQLLADSDIRIGPNTWRIYYYDWQHESPARFYRRFAERCIGFQHALQGGAMPAQPYKILSEQTFRDAVVEALKHLGQTAALRRNPLLASALVVENADPGSDDQARIRALVAQIRSAVATLGQAGDIGSRWQRVLHRAYLAPSPGQREAAAALNMGYSTYRRQLAEARNALADELWQREKAAR